MVHGGDKLLFELARKFLGFTVRHYRISVLALLGANATKEIHDVLLLTKVLIVIWQGIGALEFPRALEPQRHTPGVIREPCAQTVARALPVSAHSSSSETRTRRMDPPIIR